MSELEDLVVAVKDLEMDEQPDDTKSMEDLPPEVVTIILEHLTQNELIKYILEYRLVNSQWRDIIGSILEQRIIYGGCQVFPTLKIYRHESQDLLHVSEPPTMCLVGRNPFPFNYLILNGRTDDSNPTHFLESATDLQTRRDFMSSFGSFLTSFELWDVILPGINSLIILLSSMTSLKVLRVRQVYLLIADSFHQMDILPAPPSLPNLSTLLVESESNFNVIAGVGNGPGQVETIENILYVWLIASYADQLLKLEMDIEEPFAALQQRLHYYYLFRREKTVSIVTTSDSAFQNLKELKIWCLDKIFLRLSELPRLQHFSVTLLDVKNPPDLLDMTEFISKCRNTLEKLRLDVEWNSLMDWEARRRLHVEGILPPIIKSPLLKLKRLEIHYTTPAYQPDFSDFYTMISRFVPLFLALFPTLETLHFLEFPRFCISQGHEIITRAGQLPIAAVKTRFTSLEAEIFERIKSFQLQHAEIRFEVDDLGERYKLEGQLEQEMHHVLATFNEERAEILRELEDLGVKKQDVVLENFLESQRIWNICPNLKLVSVSSSHKPNGDVCLIRRPEEV